MNLFQWHLRSTEVERRLDELENTVNDPEKDIDDATKKINELFLFTLGARSKATKPRHRKNKPNKWYDKTCAELSKNLKLTAYLLSKSPKDPYLRGKLVKTRKEYKKLIKIKRNEYHNEMIRKLESIEENNPKEYWEIIQKLRNKKQEQKICNTEDFVSFFENLFTDKPKLNHQEKEIRDFVDMTLKDAQGEQDYTLTETPTCTENYSQK